MGDRSDKESSAVCLFQLTVKEHKDFLAAESCVFEKMFHGSLPEGDTVNITDVEPSAFIFMLNYLHKKPCCFWSKEMAMDVMHVAEKYALLELKEKCEEFLLPKRIEDVWLVANCAFLYNSTTLLKAIRELLSRYTLEFFFDENFVKISEHLVLEVVQLESVVNVTELEIFEAVLKWGNYQLKKEGLISRDQKMLRQKLEKILKHIRFLAMSSEDFSLVPAKSGVLDSKEVQSISEYISSTQEKCIPDLTVCMNTKPRTVLSKPIEKEMCPTIQVVACSLADTVLRFRKRVVQEEVALVEMADMLTIIVPSQLVTSDASCSYYQEDLRVSVNISGFLYDSINGYYEVSSHYYGCGFFKGAVQYSQEIHIPIVPSVALPKFTVDKTKPLKYIVEIKFNSKGFYPWYSPRNLHACDLMKQQDRSSGFIIGYKFMPI